MRKKVNWDEAVKPLIKKYKGKPHPLEYKNLYQLLVMVVLSAQTNDRLINNIAPELFKAVHSMKAMSNLTPELLHPYISKVIGFRKKAAWLIAIAKQIKGDENIPLTMAELTKLPGIGRKSASVIKREAKAPAEGIMVDLHVLRVAERLGITKGKDAKTVEQDLMENISEKNWGEIGMAMSHLGREICRPTEPKHEICVMNKVCAFYQKVKKHR